MKTAIYIEDGVVQLVITPESEFEKDALKAFEHKGEIEARIFSGSFYDCRGGWVRQNGYFEPCSPYESRRDNNDRSLILVNKPKEPDPPAGPCVHDPLRQFDGHCPLCYAERHGLMDLLRECLAPRSPPPPIVEADHY